ncbi:MAG: 5'-3'-deoxyribonucleotidase [Edaphobacter sp.]|uniref:5' nucleotidase, NT5C type n=1 Tax=Edaphobacter sp. TaxID=1934404 RepID=UPI0023915E4D|nr:5'-3'-deoxyribonucleotidase [Edaphobacter sp.]MDE1176820.1 5'-3'-deoxyribonucleotidase [Edaphobacter sp.]
MDEVMADALGEHIRRYNRDFQAGISLADLDGKWLWEVVAADRHDALQGYLDSDDFFESLEVMPDAQRVIRKLQQNYEVFIATAAMEVPASFAQKFRWLARHFPSIQPSHIVYCGDKGILNADFLIDDNPRQLRRFQGEGILYTSPHNIHVQGYRRVNHWLDVEKLFLN